MKSQAILGSSSPQDQTSHDDAPLNVGAKASASARVNLSVQPRPSTRFSDYDPEFRTLFTSANDLAATAAVNDAMTKLLFVLSYWAARMLSAFALVNQAEAVDYAVQTWFIEARRNASKFDASRPPSSYAFGILLHTCYSVARRLPRQTAPLTFDIVDNHPLPISQASERERARILHEALQTLPELSRLVLKDQYFDWLTAEESATRRNKSVRAIEGLRLRAHRALATALAERGFEF